MVVVTAQDVGTAALARMRRDGVLTPLTDGAGAARGTVPITVARAMSLRPWVPRRAVATGLAALWVDGLTREVIAPAHVQVVVERGSHPDPPVGVPRSRWSFSTHQADYSRARTIAGVLVAHPADAAASALCTGDLGDSLVASFNAVARGLISKEELYAAVSAHQNARGSTRMRQALKAVSRALEGR